MNNVKPKNGQSWECIKPMMHFNIGDQLSLGGGISDSHTWLQEHFKFVPQNDLEWLALNQGNWHSDGDYIYKKDGMPMLCNNPSAVCYDCHTREQWQNMRYELSLDQKPISSEEKALRRIGNAANIITKGFAEVSRKMAPIAQKETEMNTEKLIPIDFSRNITPPIYGDHVWDELRKYSFHISKENLIKICERESNNNLYVISFEDRPNTGKQPVGDDVIVDTGSYTDLAKNINWGYIDKWKPNHAAMLAKCQAEQLETVASERLANLNEDKLISHDKMLDILGEGIVKVKPVFTQANADAGELPSVGSKFKVTDIEINSRILDFLDEEVEVIGLSKSAIGNDIITFQHPTIGIGCGVYHPFWVKAIQTTEDKLREAMRNILLDSYGENLTTVIMDTINLDIDKLLASDKFEIKLKE